MTALGLAMHRLALLAGWQTIPHPDDTTVVRLALRTAFARHDPDAGGHPGRYRETETIERLWLETIL